MHGTDFGPTAIKLTIYPRENHIYPHFMWDDVGMM